MKRTKQVKPDTLRRIIWQKHKVDAYTLFYELPENKRNEILTEVFEVVTKYRLVQGKGLVSRYGRGTDVFAGYKDFQHLKSMEALTFDINQTVKKAFDRKAINRRKVFRRKKEAFEQKRQAIIKKLNRKEHLLKWEPQDEITKRRLEEIHELRKKEMERKFER